MAVVTAAPGRLIKPRNLPGEAAGATLAPRALPAGTPAFTRRELAGRRRLDLVFREMYTTGFPELDAGTPFVVGITSAVRGEGRTTTALGFAMAVARDIDVRVLLIELDLERPTLARELQLPLTPGLVDVLTRNANLETAIRRLDASGVDILPAGDLAPAVSRLLRSAELRSLLALAQGIYQVIVLDLPPALISSDVVPLSGLTDALLMVVRAGATPVRLVEQATARLGPGKIRGIILSAQRSKIPNWLRRLF
jgi:Mrp family chromosome partitioning ATPase